MATGDLATGFVRWVSAMKRSRQGLNAQERQQNSAALQAAQDLMIAGITTPEAQWSKSDRWAWDIWQAFENQGE